jgi:hypothetical protein
MTFGIAVERNGCSQLGRPEGPAFGHEEIWRAASIGKGRPGQYCTERVGLSRIPRRILPGSAQLRW